MRKEGARMGGAYPTPNEGQAMGVAPVSDDLFIVGDFLVSWCVGAVCFVLVSAGSCVG
jgi:hypothetical protein